MLANCTKVTLADADYVKINRVADRLRQIFERDGVAEQFTGNHHYLIRSAIEALGISPLFYSPLTQAQAIIYQHFDGSGYSWFTNVPADEETWINASRKRPLNLADIHKRQARFLTENPDAIIINRGGYENYEHPIPSEWTTPTTAIL